MKSSLLFTGAESILCLLSVRVCACDSMCGLAWLAVCLGVCVCVTRLSSLSDAGPMQCLYLAVGAGAVLAWKSHLTAASCYFIICFLVPRVSSVTVYYAVLFQHL